MLTSGAFGYLADYILWWALYLSLLVHTWCFFRLFPRKRRCEANGEEKRRNVETSKRRNQAVLAFRRFDFSLLRLLIGNVLIFACLLGTVALAGESYLRFLAIETDAFGVSLPARRWFALHAKLNSLGCRDVEWNAVKPDGVRRIAFVGDSFTYGWGIKRVEDRFTERVAAMFDQSAPGRVEVFNVAKPGWDSGNQIQPVRDMLDGYSLDEIVLCYVPNDIEKLLPTTDDFDPIRSPQPRFFCPDSSCLLDYLYRRLYVPRAPTVRDYHDWLAEGYANQSLWRGQQKRLYTTIRACREAGVTLRVVLLPFIRTGGKKFEPTGLHELLSSFFEVNETEVLDLLPTIAGEDPASLVVNSHDAHPNEHANALFAAAIWEAFYENEEP